MIKKFPFSKPDIIDKDIEKVVEVIKKWMAGSWEIFRDVRKYFL